ncbi:MAG: hypothetical protein AB7O04_13615 [Hyphomonadaceae bacterium]
MRQVPFKYTEHQENGKTVYRAGEEIILPNGQVIAEGEEFASIEFPYDDKI